MKLWEVAVNAPLNQLLTYGSDNSNTYQIGDSITVPLGQRKARGVIIKEGSPQDDIKLKNIVDLNSERPRLSSSNIDWGMWLSQYYVYPPGVIFESFFPSLKKHGRKKLTTEKLSPPTQNFDLNSEQVQVYSSISKKNDFDVHLIRGVTGSGKTEVYIELIKDVVKQGKQVIYLVPEISLTPQLITRFERRLGNNVALAHSQLTARDRTNQWWQMFEEKKQVLIGARSALFCPLPKLGLIIVDEEHEGSFKQDEKLKYNARDAAIMKARYENCPIILGSATPCLESWHNAKKGKYQLHHMRNRHGDSTLPSVEIINMTPDIDKVSDHLPYWLSETLYEEMLANLEKNYQTALFLNRRGMAAAVQCFSCGFSYDCPNCEISLTLHGKTQLVCHYCNYYQSIESICPECQEGEPKPYGLGTELIESDLQKLFPKARIARVDRDEIQSNEDLKQIISQIENHEVDFIVGTQMISKGLDFPKLNLVGLVMADVALNLPDFRAAEKGFQLITQMAGRSGRREVKGKVIVQTYRPEHPSISFAIKHDFEAYADDELNNRKELNYPPFGHIISLRLQDSKKDRGEQMAEQIRRLCESIKNKKHLEVDILGPVPSALAKLRNKYRFQLMLKSKDRSSLNYLAWCCQIWAQTNLGGSRLIVDVDPQSLM